MNPQTKEFIPIPTLEELEVDHGDWAKFSAGDRFTLNGVEMVIRKITKRDIVLRPVDGRDLEPSRRRKRNGN